MKIYAHRTARADSLAAESSAACSPTDARTADEVGIRLDPMAPKVIGRFASAHELAGDQLPTTADVPFTRDGRMLDTLAKVIAFLVEIDAVGDATPSGSSTGAPSHGLTACSPRVR